MQLGILSTLPNSLYLSIMSAQNIHLYNLINILLLLKFFVYKHIPSFLIVMGPIDSAK